jgi:hypothetical protein
MNVTRYHFLGLFLLLASLSVGLAAASDDGDKDSKGKGKGKGKGKSEIVQVDLSKLHPGIAQYIRDQIANQGNVQEPMKGKGQDDDKKKKGEPKKGEESKGKKGEEPKGKKGEEPKGKKGEEPKGKKGEPKKAMEISLSDAIRIAEKSGTVVKAERRGDSDEPTTFRIDVIGADGSRTKLTLDAAGRTVAQESKKGKSKD